MTRFTLNIMCCAAIPLLFGCSGANGQFSGYNRASDYNRTNNYNRDFDGPVKEQAGSGRAPVAVAPVPSQPDDAAILQAQAAQAQKVELTVTAPVLKLLREQDYREPHQRFLLSLSNGTTVLVANDLKYGTYVPGLVPGAMLRLHGEYIFNEKGGVLHWTHLSDEPRHESGWIDYNGMRYQ
jgi:hypothetical protein